MRKFLLKSVVVAALLSWNSLAAMAQTTVYGYMDGSLNAQMASFDLSAVNMDEPLVPTSEGDMPDVAEVNCGATVGDRYYAFYTEDGSYATCFGSFNFLTGEVVRVKKYSSDNAPTMKGLAYDAEAEVLYGLNYARTFDEDDNMSVTGQLVKVNIADGSLEVLKTYENDVVYDVIFGDGNNGIYWISNETKGGANGFSRIPKLYSVNVAGGYARELLVDNEEITSGFGSYSNSAIASEGKVVYLANTKVLEFDLTAKTVAQTGNMKKYVGGLTYSRSTESAEAGAEEDVATRLLVRKTWFGDAQGVVDKNMDMTKHEYFYDSEYKLSRVIESGRGYNDMGQPQGYELMNITKYNYDENNKLANTTRFQRGKYDLGDMAFKLLSTTEYEYNDKGQRIKEPSGSYIFYYEYDEAGNIAKTTKTSLSGDTIQVLEYMEFVGLNKPMLILSSSPKHPEWESYFYKSMIDYDDNGNKIMEMRTSLDDASFESWTQIEKWEYDGTFLTKYVKYPSYDKETGQPIPSSMTSYWMVDGDPNKVMHADSTYFDGKWYGAGRACLEEYVDFEGMGELTRTEIEVEACADTLNTVKLNIGMPEIMWTNDCDFNIYRNGELIATKNVFDLYVEGDFGFGVLEYKDSMLYNNDYEYFVQPVVGNSSFGPFDLDDNEEPAASEPIGYCISNVAEIKVALDLPAVTDLKYGNQRQDENDDTRVTVSWTNPEYPEQYEFISNDLYFVNYQWADTVTTDAKATELEGNFYAAADVFVLTRYKYGKAISDTLHVELVPVGIDAVATESGAAISFNGRELTLSENADVQVYSLSGRMEAKAANTGRMNLDMLNSGTYIITVSRNGKTSAHKVVLK